MKHDTSKPRASIAKVRLPPDLTATVEALAARAQTAHGAANTSAALRILLRLGLAADAQRPIDLRDVGYREGWMRGHAEAVHAHQSALHAAQARLGTRTA